MKAPSKAGALLGLALAGCGSREELSVAVGSSPTASVAAAASLAASSAAPPSSARTAGPAFARVRGTKPPGDGATARQQGATWSAPSGRVFDSVLAADLDADGRAELLAWVRSPDGSRGELMVFPGATPTEGRTVLARPGDALAGASSACKATGRIALVGPSLAMVELACEGREQGEPRWLSFVRVAGAQGDPVVAEAHVAARPEGESIAFDGLTADRDRDGTLDLVLSATLASPPSPLERGLPVTAEVVWLASAGSGTFTPDPREPEASLGRLASSLQSDAKRATSAASVDATALGLARLRSIVCGEGASRAQRRLLPASCGEPASLVGASLARLQAAATRHDGLRAVDAFTSAPPFGGREAEAKALLAKAAPEVKVTPSKLAVTARLDASGVVPVGFDGLGQLLVRTQSGTVRLAGPDFASEVPEPPPPTFPDTISVGGAALVAPRAVCDRPLLQLARGTGDVALPVLRTAAAAPCQAGALPFAWLGIHQDGTTLFAVGARLVGLDDAGRVTLGELVASPGQLGSGRSPDGGTTALGTRAGVLVVKAGVAQRFVSPLWGADVSCAPADGGALVACATASAVWVARAP
jgi:hypothetical protein